MTPKSNLDFLRACAVILVVLDHTLLALKIELIGSWQTAWIGLVGVYIFFVHTALVLMWSLSRRPHTLDFYIRRVFRIYPLALVALWAAIITHAPTHGTVTNYFHYDPVSLKNMLTTSLLVQNLFFAQSDILNVLWSLPLEVQMYLFLPFLFFFVRQEKAIWPLLLVWALVCAFCRVLFPAIGSSLAMVVPAFIPGVIAYVGFSKWKPTLSPYLLPPALFAMIALFMHHPNSRRLWVFCLALGLLLPHLRDFTTRWIVRPSHEIAKYSYGLYLGHPFSIVLGLYILRGRPLPLQLAVELLSLAAFAVAGYHLVEHPMIRLGSRVATLVENRYEHSEPATASR